MQVTKGIWCMREQCVPGSLSSSPAQEPGNEAILHHTLTSNVVTGTYYTLTFEGLRTIVG